jgi:hypothetical protein
MGTAGRLILGALPVGSAAAPERLRTDVAAGDRGELLPRPRSDPQGPRRETASLLAAYQIG